MSEALTLAEFQSTAMSLYGARRYAEALEYVSREGAHFPVQQPHFRFFQANVAAMTGQVDLAIQFLQTALDEGQWYTEKRLRNPELAALQGRLAFERIVTICVDRHEAAQAAARQLLLTAQPDPMPIPPPLLLVLHGNNDNGQETLSQWHAATQEGFMLAVAQSTQVEGPEMYVWNDEARTTRELESHFTALREAYSVDLGRVVLGGFSMGGGEAVRLAVTGQIPARGFIVVAPFFRDLAGLKGEIARLQGSALRGYIITGDKDFAYQQAKEAAADLKAAGGHCEVEEHPGLGHALPPAFDQSLRRALEFVQG